MVRKSPMWVVAAIVLCAGRAYGQDANMAAGGSERHLARNVVERGRRYVTRPRGAEPGRSAGLIVGAPGVNTDPGKVFVIFGGNIPTGNLSLSTADVVLHGAAASDRFGTATAAGNIRTTEVSDGPRDLVVGAPGAGGGAGAVYLFSAGAGFPEGAVRQAGTAGGANGYTLRILGRPSDLLGSALATADVDADGYRDIVIGAPGTARVYVIRAGLALPPSGSTVDLANPGSVPLTEISGPGIGSVVTAGDVTGDGRSEIILGAPLDTFGTGKIYVLNPVAGLLGPIALPGPATVFSGLAPGDMAGASITLPTFDTDNFKDIVIGAPGTDAAGRTDAGAVWVIWGRSTPFTGGLLSTAANAMFIGEAAGIQVGAYVTSGSVNRDSADDIVMLAAGARANQGELQLYYGGNRAARSGLIDLCCRSLAEILRQPVARAAENGRGVRSDRRGRARRHGRRAIGEHWRSERQRSRLFLAVAAHASQPELGHAPRESCRAAKPVDSSPEPGDWRSHVERDVERAMADGQPGERGIDRRATGHAHAHGHNPARRAVRTGRGDRHDQIHECALDDDPHVAGDNGVLQAERLRRGRPGRRCRLSSLQRLLVPALLEQQLQPR